METDTLKESFARVKNDIMNIQAQLMEISSQQMELFDVINDLKRKDVQLVKGISENKKTIEKKIASKKAVKVHTYIASKTGKNFHIKECPFAKNISPKSLVRYNSAQKALEEGYKACDCVRA